MMGRLWRIGLRVVGWFCAPSNCWICGEPGARPGPVGYAEPRWGDGLSVPRCRKGCS